MKTKIYLLFITTLFFCAGCGNKSGGQKQESVSAAKDTYVNPLFPEGADPSALFHNGKYYYTHGTEDKIMLWETSDITDMANAVCKIRVEASGSIQQLSSLGTGDSLYQ